MNAENAVSVSRVASEREGREYPTRGPLTGDSGVPPQLAHTGSLGLKIVLGVGSTEKAPVSLDTLPEGLFPFGVFP